MQQTLERAATRPALGQRQAAHLPPPAAGWKFPRLRLPSSSVTFIALFLGALAIQVWFNFFSTHIDCSRSCDASEYVRDAHRLIGLAQLKGTFWAQALSCLLGLADSGTRANVHNCLSVMHEFCQGGAVFPLFIGLAFVGGHIFSTSNSTAAPVLAQCFLAALIPVIVCATSARVFSRGAGILAGCLAAIYPGFIINSGRLYSELFACVLLLSSTYITVRGFQKPTSYRLLGLNGAILSALLITRSLSLLLCLLVLPITFIQQRRTRVATALAALIAGFLLVQMPWLCLQQLALGKASMIVDRVGNYNFFIGNNIKTRGWLTVPYPDGAGIEKQSMLQLAQKSILRHPQQWLLLACDKTARLGKFPWNDFRACIGPVSPGRQIAFHQWLLLLALAGIPLAFSRLDGVSQIQWRSRQFLLAVLLLNLLYLGFITVPRYNLTAAPLAIMFASSAILTLLSGSIRNRRVLWLTLSLAALGLLLQLPLLGLVQSVTGIGIGSGANATGDVRNSLVLATAIKTATYFIAFATMMVLLSWRQRRLPLAKALAVLVFILALPASCLPLHAHGRAREWTQLVQPAASIQTSINLSKAQLSQVTSRQCYLAIDADSARSLQDTSLTINGTPVRAPLIPGLALVQDYGTLRHALYGNVYWEGEYIYDCMTQAAGLSNRQLRQWFFVPLPPSVTSHLQPDQAALNVKLTNLSQKPLTIFGAYAKKAGTFELPSFAISSWEKAFYGVENTVSSSGLSDSRLDTTVPLNGQTWSQPNIRLLVPGTPSFPAQLLVSKQLTARAALDENPANNFSHYRFVPIKLPQPQPQKDALWLVDVNLVCSGQKPVQLINSSLTLKGEDGSRKPLTYRVPWTPHQERSSPMLPNHTFAFPFSPLNFTPSSNSSSSLNLEVKTDSAIADKAEAQISIWRLPAAPLGSGFQIF